MKKIVQHTTWALWFVAGFILISPQLTLGANPSNPLQANWYGYFKLDLAYDRAQSSHGNFIVYVKPHPQGQRTSTVNLTARQTRLGLSLKKEHTSGTFEIDFYGGGPENKNLVLLRKAYVDLAIGPLSVRAGQASDLISPLSPATLNYTVGWGAGNIGYRRPQLQVAAKTDKLFMGMAIARNISADLNGDAILDGEASCIPIVQTRLAYTIASAQQKLTLGGSAHYGLMDSPGAAKSDYNTWSLNGDLKIQITPRLTFLSEYYTGANTGSYFGAILNGDCVEDLRSQGGWANIQYRASQRVALSVGGGRDALINAQETYLSHSQDIRTTNTFCFGNMTYQIHPDVKTGLEVSGWQTKYDNLSSDIDPTPTDIRIQWTLQSNF